MVKPLPTTSVFVEAVLAGVLNYPPRSDYIVEWVQGGDEMYWGAGLDYSSPQTQAEVQARNVIESIGIIVGAAADHLVKHDLEPVLDCPPIPGEPDRVWAIAEAFWHEVTHRGIQIGRGQPMWLTGLYEFEYNEVLVFVQHIWAAFKAITGLDFTDPKQSAIIKSWLAVSPRLSDREYADDMPVSGEARDRLQHLIKYGGPSRAAEAPNEVVTLRGRTGTMYDGMLGTMFGGLRQYFDDQENTP